MEQVIKWFSKNHVAGNFLMLAVLIAGGVTWFGLRKEIMPEVSIDSVSISVPYPNATPAEVESGIILPLEEALSDLEGVSKITSTASASQGTILAQVANGYDLRNVMSDIKAKVDTVQNIAEEAEDAIVTEVTIRSQVLSITIVADTDEQTLKKLAEQVRDDLLLYERPTKDIFDLLRPKQKITQIQLSGVRPYEMSIEVPEHTLQELNMTLGQVADKIRSSSLDLPGGSIDTQAGQVVVRASAKRYKATEFEEILIRSNPNGSRITLSDIATIRDGFEEVEFSSKFDGKNSATIDVYRVGQQDTLILARAAKAYVAQQKDILPKGVEIFIWNDKSLMLEGRLELLKRNGTIGIALVLVVLTLFLRPSLALLVAIGIPVSFAGGIWMMPTLDVSINMISLFAFILVLGVVVDDAIVVGENVYTKIQEGMPPKVAAWKGSHEVGVIVIFGVLTTAMAFTPMLGVDGVSGKYWRNIPLIVIPTLMFSLIQSKLVLPSHLSFLKTPTPEERSKNILLRLQRSIANSLERFVEKVYSPLLGKLLTFRYIVIAIFLGVFLLIIGLVGGNHIKFLFLPDVEGDVLTANLELAEGTPFAQTKSALDTLEKSLEQLKDEFRDYDNNPVIKHWTRTDGVQSMQGDFSIGRPPIKSNLGQIAVQLTEAKNRAVLGSEIASRWRDLVGVIPGAIELSFISEASGGGAKAIDINIIGSDLVQLEQASQYAQEELAKVAGAIDITDSNRQGSKEILFKELTPSGKALGFTLADVIQQVRWAFYGIEVQRIQRGKDDIKVMVRLPKAERVSVESLEQLRLRSPISGAEVPLLQVAKLVEGEGLSTIQRIDRQRSIKISGDVDAAVANQKDVQRAFLSEILPATIERFPSVRFSPDGEVKDQQDSMAQIGLGYLVALLGMYVLMAIPLKSYIKPLIVMSAIPFGIVGAVIGHVIMGVELSAMSMCGIAALSGVVVNDSLVLVEFVSRYETEYGRQEAARRAGAARFRAIVLTSLTTFVGIMPMVLETDMQAQFLIPMAVSLGFGILFATLITLILVPSIYLMMDDIEQIFRKVYAIVSGTEDKANVS